MKRILAIIALALLAQACGGKSENASKRSETEKAGDTGKPKDKVERETDASTSTSTEAPLDFAADVSPVLEKSCGGAICHGAGSEFGVYVGQKDAFLKAGPETLARLATDDPTLVMPRAGFGMELSSTGRKTITTFLAQQGIKSGSADGDDTDSTPGTSTGTNTFTKPPSGEVQSLCDGVTASDKTEGLALSFTDIKAVGEASCGGGGCHDGSLPRGFVPVESQWIDKDYGRGILTNLATGAMPIGGKTLSAEGKRQIKLYICSRMAF